MARTRRCAGAAGFSILEAIMVLVIVLVVVGSMIPTVNRQIAHARVNRAASVCASDFYLAQALAGRMRQPVRVQADAGGKVVSIRTITDSLIQQRYYGTQGEFKLTVFSASPTQVQVLPSGMANASITLTFGDGTYQRQVRLSRAGMIRILRS